jgi:16S rRNA (uracil1498-N3)-methyltransferase
MLDACRSYDICLLAYENELAHNLHTVIDPAVHRRILVVIGPESGFADEEVRLAREAGAISVSLGPRILRTETAALVMASQLLYACEPPDAGGGAPMERVSHDRPA